MHDEIEIACPVCRAKQKPQNECRRCSADLTLYVKAMLSLETAKLQYQEARDGDQSNRVQARNYLQWLSPKLNSPNNFSLID